MVIKLDILELLKIHKSNFFINAILKLINESSRANIANLNFLSEMTRLARDGFPSYNGIRTFHLTFFALFVSKVAFNDFANIKVIK